MAGGRFSQVPAGDNQKSSPAATMRADATRAAIVVFFIILPLDRCDTLRPLTVAHNRANAFSKTVLASRDAFSSISDSSMTVPTLELMRTSVWVSNPSVARIKSAVDRSEGLLVRAADHED